MKGQAGYGRYDDDLAHVGCPWAKSDMSPCVARDGRLALSSGAEQVCVHCVNTPEYLVQDLAGYYDPARELLARGDPVTLADDFAVMVREMTEPASTGEEGLWTASRGGCWHSSRPGRTPPCTGRSPCGRPPGMTRPPRG